MRKKTEENIPEGMSVSVYKSKTSYNSSLCGVTGAVGKVKAMVSLLTYS